MKKLNKCIDITTDLLSVYYPQMAVAKIGFTKIKSLIFDESIKNLNPIKYELLIKDENFQHLILQSYDACIKSKEKEKSILFTQFFKTIVENGKFDKIDSDEIEEFIYIFSNFSYREILALHKIREFTLQNPKIKKKIEAFIMLKIEDYEKEWNIVLDFVKNKLKVKEIEPFLSRISNSELIIKTKNQGGFYISTSYFERVYKISNDMENYLNDCISNI